MQLQNEFLNILQLTLTSCFGGLFASWMSKWTVEIFTTLFNPLAANITISVSFYVMSIRALRVCVCVCVCVCVIVCVSHNSKL